MSYTITTDNSTSGNSLTVGDWSITTDNWYVTTDNLSYHYCCGCSCWWYGWQHHYCPTTITEKVIEVYKYQITCPKCENKLWAKVDEIVKCTNCKSKIKVKLPVKKDHDYEVEV